MTEANGSAPPDPNKQGASFEKKIKGKRSKKPLPNRKNRGETENNFVGIIKTGIV